MKATNINMAIVNTTMVNNTLCIRPIEGPSLFMDVV